MLSIHQQRCRLMLIKRVAFECKEHTLLLVNERNGVEIYAKTVSRHYNYNENESRHKCTDIFLLLVGKRIYFVWKSQ